MPAIGRSSHLRRVTSSGGDGGGAAPVVPVIGRMHPGRSPRGCACHRAAAPGAAGVVWLRGQVQVAPVIGRPSRLERPRPLGDMNWETEIVRKKLGDGSGRQKLGEMEVGRQKLGDGSWETEVGRQKLGDRSWEKWKL